MKVKNYIQELIKCEMGFCHCCDTYRELLELHNQELKDLIERIPVDTTGRCADDLSEEIQDFKQSELKKLDEIRNYKSQR